MKITPGNDQLEIAAPAKVNFHLELLGKRSDGFHEIETVMSSIAIYDHIRFALSEDSAIELQISYATPGGQPQEHDDIPADHRNLICKSVSLVREIAIAEGLASQCERGMSIQLLKNIPSAAGLGGASSDSAAAIIAANGLWKLNWPINRLEEIAAQLGSDIGFFLSCGTAVCRGRGEKVHPVVVPSGLPLVVVKPSDSLSTADVFSKVPPESDDIQKTKSQKTKTQKVESSPLIQSVRAGRLGEMGGQLFNRLQKYASLVTGQISALEQEFDQLDCLGHQMSGSGSSYFGVFPNWKTARLASNRLSARLPDARIFCTHTTSATASPASWVE